MAAHNLHIHASGGAGFGIGVAISDRISDVRHVRAVDIAGSNGGSEGGREIGSFGSAWGRWVGVGLFSRWFGVDEIRGVCSVVFQGMVCAQEASAGVIAAATTASICNNISE